MERKSSFKECPKCGLRNKPSATQCDFCGQNLGASDDWQHHIKDLESLNKMELRKPLDDRTSKRIESTIIRKDAPATRNMEIKEAGNIGKVLKELDEPPAKVREMKDERPRQPPAQDKLRIKEASSVPLVERDIEDTPPKSERATIADILKESAKEVEVTVPPTKPQAPEQLPSLEPMVKVMAEEPAKEVIEQPLLGPGIATVPEKTEGSPSPAAMEVLPSEKVEEPVVPAPEPEVSEEVVPTREVTVEVVQPPQEEVPSIDPVGEEGQEVTVSSSDSYETIKLKLVEVERPKEKLAPIIGHDVRHPGMAAIAVLALGSVAYLVVIALTAVGLLGTAAGLGGGAVSSFMIIYGAAVVYPSLRKKNGDEVYICPKCHEKVEESSDGCPSCGIEFESED